MATHSIPTSIPQPKVVKGFGAAVPLITALVSVLSFLGGMTLNIWKAQQTNNSSERSEWRSALEKLNVNDSDLPANTFLIGTFVGSPNYGDEAARLELGLLKRLKDPDLFDAALFDLLTPKGQTSVDLILRINQELFDELELQALRPSPTNAPATDLDPDAIQRLVTDADHSDPDGNSPGNNSDANSLIQKLDSISAELLCAWDQTCKNWPKELKHLPLDGQDLSGVVLVSQQYHDFRTIDFKRAGNFQHLSVYGHCDANAAGKDMIVKCINQPGK